MIRFSYGGMDGAQNSVGHHRAVLYGTVMKFQVVPRERDEIVAIPRSRHFEWTLPSQSQSCGHKS